MTRQDMTLIRFAPDDRELGRLFHAVRPTVVYGDRSFPSCEQYHQTVAEVVRAGHSRARAVAAAQRDWHSRGQNGCQFARLAALDADHLRWDYLVVDSTRPDRVGDLFTEHAVVDGTEVLSVLSPDITTAAQAVRFVRDLVASSTFWLERDEPVDGYRVCHLRCPVPGADRDVQAWVMGFGPFAWMPNTRRGPYFELAVRIREKTPWLFHRLNQDRDLAHLADVPLRMTDLRWEHRWTSTLSRTRRILGKEPDDFSAAKCTLAMPLEDLSDEAAAL